MDHGYGNTRLRSKGASPAAGYLRDLEALRPALLSGDPDTRRQAVTSALEQAKITDLPRTPDGRHIAADLMSFYFRSSDANDLCYRAAIGRDLCRGLEGSEQAPAPLKGRGLMPRYESDVCIIGGGITAAMLALKLSELRPNLRVIVVEAGKRLFDSENRMAYRQRNIEYAENAWPGDFIQDQAAQGVISRTMAVGGSALHWGGTCNRFSEEDLRLKSMFGLYADWPLAWTELEKFYCEAERRLGVSGEPSPFAEDRRSEPYPMPAMAMTYNLIELKKWADQSGIPFQTTPQAKNTQPYDGRAKCIRCNTCAICPTGARYSPDYTFRRLLRTQEFRAARSDAGTQTVARRCEIDRVRGPGGELPKAGRTGGISRASLRADFGLLLESASAAAFALAAFSAGTCQQFGTGGPLHVRTRLSERHDRDRRQDLSRHERAARPHFAPVLPRQRSRSFCAARFARLGKRLRTRAAAAIGAREKSCSATACWRTGGSARNAERREFAATTMSIPIARVR